MGPPSFSTVRTSTMLPVHAVASAATERIKASANGSGTLAVWSRGAGKARTQRR